MAGSIRIRATAGSLAAERPNPALNWTGARSPGCQVAAAPQCYWEDGAAAQVRWGARQLRLNR